MRRRPGSDRTGAPADVEGLAGRRLVVVTGKGGVGKTTLAAVLGAAFRSRGRRTLLLEVDPRESLHRLLGQPPSGGEFLRVEDGLYVQNLPPGRVIEAVVREQVRIEAVVRRILASPVYRHFIEGAPGLREVAVLGHAWRVVNGRAGRHAPRVDTVVVDAPATGHGVSMLAAPALVAEVIREGPFARMARELAAFVGDPERTGVAVATCAEELPVQETLELLEALDEKIGRRPHLVVVNQLHPPLGSDPGDGPGVAMWRRRREVNERQLARLADAWTGPVARLPLLPLPPGRELVDALRASLERT